MPESRRVSSDKKTFNVLAHTATSPSLFIGFCHPAARQGLRL